mmetsp:Transcript_42655/g.134699  ORF Transcript_42655/g.134699 Transcript_42655/m.134699 type:complete len:270 (+) Transcript_42655:269-1078(+)
MSARLPAALHRRRSRSSMASLPDEATRLSPVSPRSAASSCRAAADRCELSVGGSLIKDEPAAAACLAAAAARSRSRVSAMALGWFTTFCSCISRDCSCASESKPSPSAALLLPPPPPRVTDPSSWRYHERCSGVSGGLSTNSTFGSSDVSTSDLTRRTIMLSRSARACATAERSRLPSSSPTEAAASNAEEERVFGMTYARSAQSSCRLFWRGVPVRRRRNGMGSRARLAQSEDASFLRRWPSSMVTVWKRKASLKKASSARSVSYVVR